MAGSLAAGCGAFVGRMFFAIGCAGENRAGRLAENADGVAFVDGNEHALVDDGVAVTVQKHEIGRAETAAGENDGRGIRNGGVCDLRVTDDDLADGSIQLQNAGVVHGNAQHVVVAGHRRCRHDAKQGKCNSNSGHESG